MRLPLTLMLIAALLPACGTRTESAPAVQREVAPVLSGEDARDIHSYAAPFEARVTHLDLDLAADFASRKLSGTAALDVEAAGDTAILTLDTRGLLIEGVSDAAGNALAWELGSVDPILGAPLRVTLGAARRVVVRYHTGNEAEALQWLQPEQTAGGKLPFLFSQGQAILTRTWIPTQDSPGIRQTWSARIVAPAELTAVMSGTKHGSEAAGEGSKAWRFSMDHPVAPYLIAIAIGDLAFRELGPHTGVYTEPVGIDAAAAEFADLEAMLTAAEGLYGAYRWDRYDVLVLPPAFPFGGMENPTLTFATPTIIAGDKSLVSLIAHELAHSWSGNLVTNATWADFWLNEGFTSYIEGRIMETVYGPRAAGMLASLGWDGLQAEVQRMGATAPDTRLHIDLAGRSPDDGLTDIAYEKGAHFLRTIEQAVGRERWDAWLKAYFDRHAFQPQTSRGFLEDLRANLLRGDTALEKQIGLDEWVYGVGLPANIVHVESEAFIAVDAAAAAFAARGALPTVTQWSYTERVRFLNRLPRKLPAARLGALATLLQVETQKNSEVRFAWLMLAVANRYPPAAAQVEDFLTSQGRRKFVQPLFAALMEQGTWGRTIATRVYAEARPGYHAVTTGSVDKIVPLAAGATSATPQ